MSGGTQGERLRWRCRRGMVELDVLLLGFLDFAYERSEPQLRGAFDALVELDDVVILDLLSGRSRPTSPAMAELLARLSRLPAAARR